MGTGRKHLRALARCLPPTLIMLAVVGCTGSADIQTGADSTLLASLSLSTAVPTLDDDGNDSFTSASELPQVDELPQVFRAVIADTADVDVYSIGDLVAGQHLIVDIAGDDQLDAAAAVFDADANLIYLNDDRNFFARLVDPLIDVTVRRDTEQCYLVVTASPNSRSRGTYTIASSAPTTDPIPSPNAQQILLNFDGATGVAFGGRTPVDMPYFDAADLSSTLAGQTETLIQLIAEKVRRDYEGLDVDIYTSREDVELGDDVSTVHFGAFDRALLGVAENIDEFNERTTQEAIVFTDTFKVFKVLDPSLEQYAQAFANVASHEIGHLLGLVHTSDVQGIMDITASLRLLMRDQSFSVSQIESATFPVGFQDAPRSLVDAVGGDLDFVRLNAASARQIASAKIVRPAGSDPLIDLPRPVLSTCSLRHHE